MKSLLGWDGWPKFASLLTAAAAIAALLFTAQSLRATQDQIGLIEQGQLTDRFGKAVEQLGSDKSDVRLGGIYALERLARDSRRDHPTIMEILTAFIRSQAPRANCPAHPDVSVLPRTDVQAALTVIGRRIAEHDLRADRGRLNLTRTCLAGAYFMGTYLFAADLTGANLSHADLANVDLTNALLADAILTGVNLTGAHLTNAELVRANLTGTNLTRVNLTEANLTDASLLRANLTNARVILAKLARVNLTDANLTNADLTATKLSGANLTGAILTNAKMPR